MEEKTFWEVEFETPNINDGFDIDIIEGVAKIDRIGDGSLVPSLRDLVLVGISAFGPDFLVNTELQQSVLEQCPGVRNYNIIDLGVKFPNKEKEQDALLVRDKI